MKEHKEDSSQIICAKLQVRLGKYGVVGTSGLRFEKTLEEREAFLLGS